MLLTRLTGMLWHCLSSLKATRTRRELLLTWRPRLRARLGRCNIGVGVSCPWCHVNSITRFFFILYLAQLFIKYTQNKLGLGPS